jgi:hypothetical protein
VSNPVNRLRAPLCEPTDIRSSTPGASSFTFAVSNDWIASWRTGDGSRGSMGVVMIGAKPKKTEDNQNDSPSQLRRAAARVYSASLTFLTDPINLPENRWAFRPPTRPPNWSLGSSLARPITRRGVDWVRSTMSARKKKFPHTGMCLRCLELRLQ